MRPLPALVWTALLLPSLGWAGEVAPQSVAAGIQRAGARKTIAELVARDLWETVLRHVAAGNREWLALVPAMKPGTDAGTAEGLQQAVSLALQNNAQGVLDLAGRNTYPLPVLCAVPMIEPTAVQVAAFKRRAMAALERVMADRKDVSRARRSAALSCWRLLAKR